MKFEKQKIQLIYIDIKYLEYLSNIDPEIWYDKNNNYEEKPHVGILIANNNYKYVIPLTSAKEKHKNWDDVTSSWYRVYEIVNTKEQLIRDKDIIVDIKNQDILKTIKEEDIPYTKQKILSVLDMRKMFPIKEGTYSIADMETNSNCSKEEYSKKMLLFKEYLFTTHIRDEIAKKATKIYEKQISKKKVFPYHCDYVKLEKACDDY